MSIVFPNTLRMNRGTLVIKDLVRICQQKNYTDLILLHEHRGEPDGMIISHLPVGPTIYFGLSNVVLRHDLKTKLDAISEAFPHLIFNNFSTNLGDRITTMLKHLFPIPKHDSKSNFWVLKRRGDNFFEHGRCDFVQTSCL